MIPPILTDEEAEAMGRGWRRTRSGWEIPTLLLQPVAPGPGGTWRTTSSPLHGYYNFAGSEADCLRVALRNPRYFDATSKKDTAPPCAV